MRSHIYWFRKPNIKKMDKILVLMVILSIVILPVACSAQDLQNESGNLVSIERVARLFRFYGLVFILLIIVIIVLCITVIKLSQHKGKQATIKKEVKSKEKEVSKDDGGEFKGDISPGKKDILKTLSKTEEEIILELLNNNGKLTQNDLHANTGIPRSTLSRTLKSLEQKKLLDVRGVGVTNLVKLQDWFVEK